MSRLKHVLFLMFKLIIVYVCFLYLSCYYDVKERKEVINPITDYLNDSNIVIECKNGAVCNYKIEDNNIVFTIDQQGLEFDDIKVNLNLSGISFNKTKLQENLGFLKDYNDEYLNEITKGPWNGNISYILSADELNGNYTFEIENIKLDKKKVTPVKLDMYGKVINVINDIRKNENDDETFRLDKKLSLNLIFGTNDNGALPSGEYTLSSYLSLNGLHKSNTNAHLNVLDDVLMIQNIVLNNFFEKGPIKCINFDVFKTLSSYQIIKKMYVYLCVLCIIAFIFKVFMIFTYVVSSKINTLPLFIKSIFKNGFWKTSDDMQEEGSSKTKFLCTLIIFVMPIDLIIGIFRDIYYIIVGNLNVKYVSISANVIGTTGLYLIIFSVLCFLSKEFILGPIFIIIGFILFVCGYKIQNRVESE